MGDRQEKVLRVGTLTVIGTLDPHRAHDFTSQLVISQAFESPYVRVDGRREPNLVVGPPARRDPNTFELQLRSGLKFSDGSPVTHEDFAASIKPAVSPHGIETIALKDRLLLHARAWPHRLEDLLSTVGAKIAKRSGAGAIGTGPFAIAEASSRGVRLVRNLHSRRQARIDAIEIRWYLPSADGRPDALVAALESGEVDFTVSLSRDDIGELHRVRKLFHPGMGTAFIALNTSKPHFSKVQTRRAFALAIDRYRLTELCYSNPAAFVARSLLPPGLGRGNDGLRHDPIAARAVLDRAGLPARLKMVRVWGPRPYLARPDAVAGGIERQLQALGIVVDTIAAKDSEDYGALLALGDYDLVLGGWFADTPDPIDYLASTVGSGGILSSGQVPVAASNYAQWRDAEVDRLLMEAASGASTRVVDEILARVASEVPLIPLMHGPRVIVHAWRVKGYDAGVSGLPDFATIDLQD